MLHLVFALRSPKSHRLQFREPNARSSVWQKGCQALASGAETDWNIPWLCRVKPEYLSGIDLIVYLSCKSGGFVKNLYLLVSVLVAHSAGFAQPTLADCSGLLQPAKVDASKHTGQALALAAIFDSMLVSSAEKNESLGVMYGTTSLDFRENDISKLRQIISQKLKYNYQSVADERYLASFLTPAQLSSFVECKRFSDNNPHAELYWTDTLSVVAPGARPTRTIDIILMFVGNNEVPKYKLDLKVNGQASKQLPSSWGNLKSTQAFAFKTADISSPISITANFSAGSKPATAASITIPPVLPRINSHIEITPVRTAEVQNECKGPAIVSKNSEQLNASNAPSSISYLRNPMPVVTNQAGEAFANNSGVFSILSEDRQQLVAHVVCQAHGDKAWSIGRIDGYAAAQNVAIVIDSIDY